MKYSKEDFPASKYKNSFKTMIDYFVEREI